MTLYRRWFASKFGRAALAALDRARPGHGRPLAILALAALLALPLCGCLDMFFGAAWFACRGDLPGCGGKHHKAEPEAEQWER